jgi:hypothetical protein
MRSILIIFFCVVLFAGCKKLYPVAPNTNTDVTNGIFRVVATSDVQFSILITELDPGAQTADTISVIYPANLQFSYGFTPKANAKMTVKVSCPKATSLLCTILYKGAVIGPAAPTKTSEGLEMDFDYAITN